MTASKIHDNQRYLTPKEAAGYMRKSKSYLDKLRVSGGGPLFIKTGNRILYRIGCLDDWMQAHEYGSTSEIVPLAA